MFAWKKKKKKKEEEEVQKNVTIVEFSLCWYCKAELVNMESFRQNIFWETNKKSKRVFVLTAIRFLITRLQQIFSNICKTVIFLIMQFYMQFTVLDYLNILQSISIYYTVFL